MGATHETEADAARAWATFACRRLTGDGGVPPECSLPVALVSQLGLGPLLYRTLSAEGDTRARLFLTEFRHATTANLLRLAHARRLRDRFEAAGVPAVLLKGAATLVRFGDEPGLRPMADLDLLVRPADVGRAATLLRAVGLAERGRYPLSAARSHAISFVGPAGPLDFDVDLHRGLAPWPLAAALARAILAHHDVVDGWRIPYPADAICATAVHRAGHGFVGSCVELVDLKRLAGLLDDRGWEKLRDAADRFGVLGAVYASLRQAYWWLGPEAGSATRGFAALGQRLHAARRALLHGLAPVDALVRPRPFLNGPLGRNLLVMPCATGQGLRALAAATRLLPFRVADEWQRHRRETRGVGPAARRLLAQLVFGATSPVPPPGPPAR